MCHICGVHGDDADIGGHFLILAHKWFIGITHNGVFLLPLAVEINKPSLSDSEKSC